MLALQACLIFEVIIMSNTNNFNTACDVLKGYADSINNILSRISNVKDAKAKKSMHRKLKITVSSYVEDFLIALDKGLIEEDPHGLMNGTGFKSGLVKKYKNEAIKLLKKRYSLNEDVLISICDKYEIKESLGKNAGKTKGTFASGVKWTYDASKKQIKVCYGFIQECYTVMYNSIANMAKSIWEWIKSLFDFDGSSKLKEDECPLDGIVKDPEEDSKEQKLAAA